jgi:hypothetical protein
MTNGAALPADDSPDPDGGSPTPAWPDPVRGSDGRGPRAVVKLRSPPEICDAIPYLVGFQPEDSIVVVCLRGERKRIGVVVRFDLPPADLARPLARQVVDVLVADGATAAVFVVYGERGSPAADQVVTALRQELRRERLHLEEGLHVADGLWTSYTCRRPCCPPTGTPLPSRIDEPSVLGAAMIAEGRQVLPTRAALVATLDPVTGERAAALQEAVIDELARLAADETDGSGGADETVELARDWSERLADPRASLPDEVAVRLLVGLTDCEARDRLLPWPIHGLRQVTLGPGVGALWVELVRRAVLPGLVAAPATLLGWVRYLLEGSGTLANIAVERALDDDPDYALALHLENLVQQGVPPKVVRRWFADVDADAKSRRSTDRPAAASARGSGSRRRSSRPRPKRQ